jgi:uncharacterized protein YndB with AHSA1/START domain
MSEILWRLHLATSPEAVWDLLATDEGRQRFWAERSHQAGGSFELRFPNGERVTCVVQEERPPYRFVVSYFDGSRLTWELTAATGGGTVLTLRESGVPEGTLAEQRAGWVSVLLCLKAAADFGIDLRNHDRERTWDQGYVEN